MPGVLGLVRLGSAQFCRLDGAHHSLRVYLADALGWLAGFDLDEVIRPDAHEAVSRLYKVGVEVQMLSGDSYAAARRVADQLGIKVVQGDCTPQNKLKHLQALQQQGRKVLMVGDGLNDGPVGEQ